VPNAQPFIVFLRRTLETIQPVGEPLTCHLESASLDHDEGGDGLLEVRLAPSAIDPPKDLCLIAGNAIVREPPLRVNLPGEGEMLLGERLVQITIPKALLGDAGDVVQIPYQVAGHTILDRPIDTRGVWELPNSKRTALCRRSS
jgi:hypothetical protein